MSIVTVIFFPIVLAYQGWNLWVFRKRLGAPPQGRPAETGGEATAVSEAH